MEFIKKYEENLKKIQMLKKVLEEKREKYVNDTKDMNYKEIMETELYNEYKNTEQEYKENKEYLELENKAIAYNYKVAQTEKIKPILVDIFKKHNGKRLGEKTKEKLYNELKEKTNLGCYIDKWYDNSSNSIQFYPLTNEGYKYYNRDFEFFINLKYSNDLDTQKYFVDKENYIRDFETNDLYNDYSKKIDNIDQFIKNSITEKDQLIEKIREIKGLTKEYNANYGYILNTDIDISKVY